MQQLGVKRRSHVYWVHSLLTDNKLYLKTGTNNTLWRVRLGSIGTLPVWVTIILKELGNVICKGTGREVKEVKNWESKHMCSEAPESMIQVLELNTVKHEAEYFWTVPEMAEALNPIAVLFCFIFRSLATCFTKAAYCSLLSWSKMLLGVPCCCVMPWISLLSSLGKAPLALPWNPLGLEGLKSFDLVNSKSS